MMKRVFSSLMGKGGMDPNEEASGGAETASIVRKEHPKKRQTGQNPNLRE
jgi:hypothetical protein